MLWGRIAFEVSLSKEFGKSSIKPRYHVKSENVNKDISFIKLIRKHNHARYQKLRIVLLQVGELTIYTDFFSEPWCKNLFVYIFRLTWHHCFKRRCFASKLQKSGLLQFVELFLQQGILLIFLIHVSEYFFLIFSFQTTLLHFGYEKCFKL